MKIDCHVHLVGLRESNGCWVSRRMGGGPLFYGLSAALGLRGVPRADLDRAYVERLTEWVSGSQLDAIGVLALDGVYDRQGELDRRRTHLMVSNDYLFRVCASDPAFLPVASVNPARRDALDELDRVSELGAVAIKTLPNSQGFDPGEARFRPFWRQMASHGLPLLTHTSFEHTIPPISQHFGRPERLRSVLDEGVTVIAAHCASAGVIHWHEDFDTFVDMLGHYDRLYGDISAMASVSRFPYIHRVLASETVHSRVLFGSDFPIPVSPRLFVRQLGWTETSRLARIKNPLERNLQTFQALGVADAVFARAADVFRLDFERERSATQDGGAGDRGHPLPPTAQETKR